VPHQGHALQERFGLERSRSPDAFVMCVGAIAGLRSDGTGPLARLPVRGDSPGVAGDFIDCFNTSNRFDHLRAASARPAFFASTEERARVPCCWRRAKLACPCAKRAMPHQPAQRWRAGPRKPLGVESSGAAGAEAKRDLIPGSGIAALKAVAPMPQTRQRLGATGRRAISSPPRRTQTAGRPRRRLCWSGWPLPGPARPAWKCMRRNGGQHLSSLTQPGAPSRSVPTGCLLGNFD